MEPIQVGEKTYYLKNATNIGIYKLNEKDVCVIDTGNDKDAGKKILKAITEQGWEITTIINTHSHADHIGGNQVLQERTGASIYASEEEIPFIEHPLLEPSMLYGGYPFLGLQNKFLCAKKSKATAIAKDLPEGLEVLSLPGHSPDMIGIKTSDNVYFLGDALVSQETIDKYHIFYLYSIEKTLQTLNALEVLTGTVYIPSHVEATKSIHTLIDLNRQKIEEIQQKILEICLFPISFEDILKKIFDTYHLVMNTNQYVLVGSTIRSYLSYLLDENKLEFSFEDNKIYFKTKEKA